MAKKEKKVVNPQDHSQGEFKTIEVNQTPINKSALDRVPYVTPDVILDVVQNNPLDKGSHFTA